MNKKMIIIGIGILFAFMTWVYPIYKYTGKYVGFKCGGKSHNNIFILKLDGTYIFQSDHLLSDLDGEWKVSIEETITFMNKKENIHDIGTIRDYNLHTNRERKFNNIPYAKGCYVYIRSD